MWTPSKTSSLVVPISSKRNIEYSIRYIIPETGVKIKEGQKSKEGNNDFKAKYGAYSKHDYTKLLESLPTNSLYYKSDPMRNAVITSAQPTHENDVSIPIPKEQIRFQSVIPIPENVVVSRNELKLSKNLNTSMQKVFEILDFVPEYEELKLMTDLNHNNIFKKSKENSNFGSLTSPSEDITQKLNRDIIRSKDWGNNTILQNRSINVVTSIPNISNKRNLITEKEEPKYRSAFTEAARSMLSSTKRKILLKLSDTLTNNTSDIKKRSKEKKQVEAK